jgi:hypothetical protein
MQSSEVDPDLERQLEAAREDERVEAVLLLKDDAGHKPLIDVEALIKRLRECGGDDIEMNYMPRVGALIVRARSRVLRLLISQPEVEMASANRAEGDAGL